MWNGLRRVDRGAHPPAQPLPRIVIVQQAPAPVRVEAPPTANPGPRLALPIAPANVRPAQDARSTAHPSGGMEMPSSPPAPAAAPPQEIAVPATPPSADNHREQSVRKEAVSQA
ncbi:MAG TPA: hypothetical protein VFE62_25675, partial [Gemmataceae bacterium]|nr:hypothetical protein [Gemmataceae bacterium]